MILFIWKPAPFSILILTALYILFVKHAFVKCVWLFFVFFLWFSCDLCWVYLVLWYCSNLSLCVVFLNLTFFLYCIQICILLLLVIALFSVSLLKETGCWLSFMLCNWTGEAIYRFWIVYIYSDIFVSYFIYLFLVKNEPVWIWELS